MQNFSNYCKCLASILIKRTPIRLRTLSRNLKYLEILNVIKETLLIG